MIHRPFQLISACDVVETEPMRKATKITTRGDKNSTFDRNDFFSPSATESRSFRPVLLTTATDRDVTRMRENASENSDLSSCFVPCPRRKISIYVIFSQPISLFRPVRGTHVSDCHRLSHPTALGSLLRRFRRSERSRLLS